jgi:hypothetical protein
MTSIPRCAKSAKRVIAGRCSAKALSGNHFVFVPTNGDDKIRRGPTSCCAADWNARLRLAGPRTSIVSSFRLRHVRLVLASGVRKPFTRREVALALEQITRGYFSKFCALVNSQLGAPGSLPFSPPGSPDWPPGVARGGHALPATRVTKNLTSGIGGIT